MPKGKMPKEFITPLEASKVLGCGTQAIETGLRNGTFPIGFAWHTHTDDRNGKWHFRIPRETFLQAVKTGLIKEKAV